MVFHSIELSTSSTPNARQPVRDRIRETNKLRRALQNRQNSTRIASRGLQDTVRKTRNPENHIHDGIAIHEQRALDIPLRLTGLVPHVSRRGVLDVIIGLGMTSEGRRDGGYGCAVAEGIWDQFGFGMRYEFWWGQGVVRGWTCCRHIVENQGGVRSLRLDVRFFDTELPTYSDRLERIFRLVWPLVLSMLGSKTLVHSTRPGGAV